MYTFSAREKILLLSLVISLGLAELLLEFQSYQSREFASTVVRPFYSFELQDSEGRRISSTKGILALSLDPLAGWINKPNTRSEHFSIDALGFRRVPNSYEGSPSSTVAILGGSTAFSTGSTNDSTTYSNYIAQGLKTARVINGATIGHTSTNELGIFTSRLVDQDVKSIISLTGWNDFQQWSPTQPRSLLTQIEERLLRMEQIYGGSLPARYYLGLTSTLLPALQERIQHITSPQYSLIIPGIGVVREPVVKLAPISAAGSFMRNRLKIDKIAKGLGIESCIILQPDLKALDAQKNGLTNPYNSFRQEVIRQAREANMRIFDAGVFPSPLQPHHFADRIHLSDEGNKVLADYTLPFVQSCLLKTPVDSKPL